MDQATVTAALQAQLRITHVRAAANGLRMHTKLHGGLNRATRRKTDSKRRERYADALRNYFTSVTLGKIRLEGVAAYAARHGETQ